ncbi:efflux RND transporter permease subunit [Ureibacillus sp. FSL K6-3587]|uniref:efflux RND transporter permease subunit n=1 Tax=Ureibacillus sp. FSL K6-3587 TaxID=2954681 RepID=UPI0031592B46
MNGLVNFVIKNKLAVWLLAIILMVTGIYSTSRMNKETIPDISIPYITVMTVYPGATPEQSMNDISIPLEKAVQNLRNVVGVYSTSYSNMSSVQIEYEYGTDMLDAERELRSVIDGMEFPDTAQDPTIARITVNTFPILALSVSSDTEDIAELTATVEDVIVPKLEGIDGVSSVSISGQHVNKVEIEYDQVKMASLGVTEDDVKQMIQASDLKAPLGLYPFKEKEQSIVIDGKFTTVDELKNLLIPVTPTAQNPTPFVTLGDIAKVKLVGEVESVSRTNGKEAIGIQIVKGQDANTVEVVNEAKDIIKELEAKNDGLHIDVTLDQGEPIEESVSTMLGKALYGAGFAIIIILLFLRDIKSTIISIISIPLSLLIAFTILHQMDITLNIMTLGAMTVAIGRVIDDSIVVVENIYRRLHLKDEKLKGRALIRSATIEMFKPILASTLVTIAVFAPLVLVGGMVGELFTPFAFTMAFALLASLLVAITVVPSLSHTLFKKRLYGGKKGGKVKHEKPGALALWYKKVLRWSLNHKVVSSLIAIALLVGSLFLIPVVGFSFLSADQEKVMYLTYTPEPGESEEKTLENVQVVEDKLLARDDVDIVQVSIGGSGNAMMGMMGTDGALMYVIFDDDTKNFDDVQDEITNYIEGLDQSGKWINQNFSMSMSNNELSYTVYGDDMDKIEKTVADIENIMKESGNLKDVDTSLSERFDEFTLRVNQQTLLQYGLTAGQLAMMLNPNKQDEVLTTLKKDGTDIDVIVKRNVNLATSFEDLLNQPVPTATGAAVQLKDIVQVEEGTVSNTISRSKGQLYASVSGTVTSKDVTKASKEVDEKIDKLELPKGVEIGVSGVTADMEEAFTQLGFAMIVAIGIVYFILVVTFGEGLAPFAILFSLPFTVIGSLVGLWIAGETISVSVMMGMLMLIGIVVTNAVVLVDRIINMERTGMPMREAILEAGATRLRPILMTAIATIGALIPLAIGAEGSGMISRDLGICVIGGLFSSTMLTLIVVPIVYEILSKVLRKNRTEIEED